MNVDVVLPLEKMSVAEKLEVIDTIWRDLIESKSSIPVPAWHKEILESRREAFRNGEIGYTNWDEAKEEIRRRVS